MVNMLLYLTTHVCGKFLEPQVAKKERRKGSVKDTNWKKKTVFLNVIGFTYLVAIGIGIH